MRFAIKLVLALAGVAAIVGFIAGPYLLGETDTGRKLYVKSNDAVLQRVPVPSGSEEVDHTSAPYYAAAKDAPIAGYRTTVVYRVHRMSVGDVMSFYRARMKRWRAAPGCRLRCSFVRGDKEVVIDVRKIRLDSTYAVIADYAGAQS
jgi:hypothetical protein